MTGGRLGPYALLAELGSGGMGKVYRAEVVGAAPGLEPGRTVAVKVIHAHLLERPGFFKRFLREADVGRTIEHENVVRTYDHDALLQDGTQQNFLVMEHVEGQTLRDLLEELERVPEKLCQHVGREVARGLAAIHEAGVVHRDLKPENVLITKDHVVKIMDLGVAHLQDEALRLSQAGMFLGSVQYAAPEAFRGEASGLDGRADLYALGVILYELATGRHPFAEGDMRVAIRQTLEEQPPRIGKVNPQLSPFYEEVVHTLLAKTPESRFGSAGELLAVLEAGEASTWWRHRAQSIRLETNRPLRRIRLSRETAVYGRGDDLDHLLKAYAEAKDGHGHVVLLEGEAGIGKTRVADELVRRLEEQREDVNVLYGAFDPVVASARGGAFTMAFREYFGTDALEEVLPDYLEATPRLVPAFAALLQGVPPPPGEDSLARGALHTVFAHATRTLAAERPTVVIVDDLHFAPAEGRELFLALSRVVPEHRILLLGTMRRSISRTWVADVVSLDHADRLELQRLGAKDLARLLEEAFRSKRLASSLGHEIAVKSDGNPFLAFEIIRGLREGLFITQASDGSWVPTQAIKRIEVPSSIGDLVHARIAGLDDKERELLDVAACCGYEFDPEWIALAVDIPHVRALRTFSRLERAHRLVRTQGRQLVFDHHYVQERLYDSLFPKLREAYHVSLAEALETRVGGAGRDVAEIPGADCVRLCRHFLAGRRGRRALRYLEPALKHLAAGYAYEPALELIDQALEAEGLLEGESRVATFIDKANRLDVLGRRREQGEAIDAALALLDDRTPGKLALEVRIAKGVWLDHAADYTAAREMLEACVADATQWGERQGEAYAHGYLGNVYFAIGRLDDARAEYESCVEVAREIGDRVREAMAIGSLGNIHAVETRYGEAEKLIEQLIDVARESGDRRVEGAGYGNLGVIALFQGRYDEALAFFERRLAIARETGDRHGEAHAIGHIGNTLRQVGRLDEARSCGEQYVTITGEVGDKQEHALAVGYLGDTLEALGLLPEAEAHYERQVAMAEAIADPGVNLRAELNLGSLHLDLGRLADARQRLKSAHETAEETGDAQSALRLARKRAMVELVLGNPGRVRDLLGDVRARADAGESEVLDAGSLVCLARADELEGELEAAIARARRAVDLLRSSEDRADLGAALVVQGRLESALGRHAEAVALLDEAIELARAVRNLRTLVLAATPRVAYAGFDRQELAQVLETSASTIPVDLRLGAHHALWRATGDAAHLEEAHHLLDLLIEHAPPEDRASACERVPVHRDVREAARAQGIGA